MTPPDPTSAPHAVPCGRNPVFSLTVLISTAVLCAGCGDGVPSGEPSLGGPAEGSDAQVAAPTGAITPSFDCDRADGEIEELICGSPELATLDLRLDSTWQEIEKQLESGSWPESERNAVRTEQRGWIEGRNECWKAADPTACTVDEYVRRIVTLQASFGLVPPDEPTFWGCEGNPADEFVLSFVPTDPPSVRVERGDRQEVMIRTPTASGERYLGTFGTEVWVKGDEGTFVWPQTDTLTCERKSDG